MKKSIKNWQVRKTCCLSCPFRIDPATGREQNPYLVGRVTPKLFDASQRCHHPRLHGVREFELCRGARNWQLMIFHRLGFLESPTDEAWEKINEPGPLTSP